MTKMTPSSLDYYNKKVIQRIMDIGASHHEDSVNTESRKEITDS